MNGFPRIPQNPFGLSVPDSCPRFSLVKCMVVQCTAVRWTVGS